MAVYNDSFVGSWKFSEVVSLCNSGYIATLQGIVMQLAEDGGVSWIIPKGGDDKCPLLLCDTYDVHISNRRKSASVRSLMMTSALSHTLIFQVHDCPSVLDYDIEDDRMLLTLADWAVIMCIRRSPSSPSTSTHLPPSTCTHSPPSSSPLPDHSFSLAPLLQDSAACCSDFRLVAADGTTEFPTHLLVLQLRAPSLNWDSQPLRHLSAEQLRLFVHWLYTDSVPAGTSPQLAGSCQLGALKLPTADFGALASLCGRYVRLSRLQRHLYRLSESVNDSLLEADASMRCEDVNATGHEHRQLSRLGCVLLECGTQTALALDLCGDYWELLDTGERRRLLRYAHGQHLQLLRRLIDLLVPVCELLQPPTMDDNIAVVNPRRSRLHHADLLGLVGQLLAVMVSLLGVVTVAAEHVEERERERVEAQRSGSATPSSSSLSDVLLRRRLKMLSNTRLRMEKLQLEVARHQDQLAVAVVIADDGGGRLGGGALGLDVGRRLELLQDAMWSLLAGMYGRVEQLGRQQDCSGGRSFRFLMVSTISLTRRSLRLLRAHKATLQPVIATLDMHVHSPLVDRTLQQLGLKTDEGSEAASSSDPIPSEEDMDGATANQRHGSRKENDGCFSDGVVDLNILQDMTQPPLSRQSELARRCHQLFLNCVAGNVANNHLLGPQKVGEESDYSSYELIEFVVVFDADEEQAGSVDPKESTSSGTSDVLSAAVAKSKLDDLVDPKGSCSATSASNVTTFHVHAVLMVPRWPWLRRALQSGMREATERRFEVHGASPAAFRHLLEFIYCGHVTAGAADDTDGGFCERLVELLGLADRYELEPLRESCEQLLIGQQLAEDDSTAALWLLAAAERYNAPRLKSAALEFVSTHAQTVAESPLLAQMPEELAAEVQETLHWAQPPPRDRTAANARFPRSAHRSSDLHGTEVRNPEPPSSSPDEDQSSGDGEELLQQLQLSSSEEDFVGEHHQAEAGCQRLEAALQRLRNVIGAKADRSVLVRLLLSSDYDVNRAINYFFSS